jgi:hypothetical protein
MPSKLVETDTMARLMGTQSTGRNGLPQLPKHQKLHYDASIVSRRLNSLAKALLSSSCKSDDLKLSGTCRAMTMMSLCGVVQYPRRYSRITRRKRLRSTARRIFFFEVTKPMRCPDAAGFNFAKTKKSRVLDLASGLSNTASKSLRDGNETTVMRGSS